MWVNLIAYLALGVVFLTTWILVDLYLEIIKSPLTINILDGRTEFPLFAILVVATWPAVLVILIISAIYCYIEKVLQDIYNQLHTFRNKLIEKSD